MITLNEHIEIAETIALLEGESPVFSEEQIEAAEFYNLSWNPVSGCTEMTLSDADGKSLGTVSFEDADVAIAFLEEYFDIDAEEIADLETYDWAQDTADNYEDRVNQNIIGDV